MKENSVFYPYRGALAVLVVSFMTAYVSAQVPATVPADDGSVGKGIEQLVEMALSANADLQATRQRVNEAKGILRQSTLKINPPLDTSYGSGGPFGSTSLSELSVGYSQTFELGGKRARRVEVSEWGVKLAEFEIAERERQLRAEVKSRYGEALAAIRNLQITDRQLELTREIFRITTARVQQGEAPAVDQGLLQVEVGRLESDRSLVENLVARTLLSIKPLTGVELNQPPCRPLPFQQTGNCPPALRALSSHRKADFHRSLRLQFTGRCRTLTGRCRRPSVLPSQSCRRCRSSYRRGIGLSTFQRPIRPSSSRRSWCSR